MEMDRQQWAPACNSYEWLLADYLSGDCNAADSTRVAAHLRACPNCRAAFEDVQAGMRLLQWGGPLLEQSLKLWLSI